MPLTDLVSVARRVATDVAGPVADEVDRDGRFPEEAVAAFRAEGLLAALVPEEWGGAGQSVADASRAVTAVAEQCASSALVLAMHHIQVACILGHGGPAMLATVLPRVVSGDLLLANANSEVGLGGDRRTSLCALEPVDGGHRLSKEASTVSYGEYADGVVATARRTPDSLPGDQALAVCLPPSLELTPKGEWDTMGLRGTCSRPAVLRATVPDDMVIADYAAVFMRTSLPVSAILLSSVWLGLAEAAGRTAHRAVRAKARRERAAGGPAPLPLAAVRLAELGVALHQIREVVAGGAAAYDRDRGSSEVESFRFSGRMDNLKLSATTLTVDIAQRAMGICGLAGYQNDSPVTMARILRDATAAPLMVNSDRALLATAQALLARKSL